MSHGTVGVPNRFHMGSKSKPVMAGCAAPGTRWSGDKELVWRPGGEVAARVARSNPALISGRECSE